MFRPIQIASLKVSRINAEVRAALRKGVNPDRIADFVAAVDWSGAENASDRVRERLGLLELWATAYAEAELSRGEYLVRLLSLLPSDERSRRLVIGEGPITMMTLENWGQPAVVRQFPTELEFPALQVAV